MGVRTGLEADDTGCFDHIIKRLFQSATTLSEKKDDLSFVLAKVVKIFLVVTPVSQGTLPSSTGGS